MALIQGGRPGMKSYLTENSSVDPSTLPYNKKVIAYINNWREKGGHTALVSATDKRYVSAIANHLQLFDDVFGSDKSLNLKGPVKANFLKNQYGIGKYDYIGDSLDDLPVWQGSKKSIVVNPSERLKKRIEKLGLKYLIIGNKKTRIGNYMMAIRYHQWLKNILVFSPIFITHVFTTEALISSVLAFIAFSFVSSSAYVVNDLIDLSEDRIHPRKKNRPFASGGIPIVHGMWMSLSLFFSGILVSIGIGSEFLSILLGYFAITTTYSIKLKKLLIIDVSTLACLYTLRILAGGAAINISVSYWLVIFSIFFFFSLAIVKRLGELEDGLKIGKKDVTGRGYNVNHLPKLAQSASAAGLISVLVMALYINSPNVFNHYSNPKLLWGICIILLFWISRMVMKANNGKMHDDPLVFAFRDKLSIFCGLLVVLLWVLASLL